VTGSTGIPAAPRAATRRREPPPPRQRSVADQGIQRFRKPATDGEQDGRGGQQELVSALVAITEHRRGGELTLRLPCQCSHDLPLRACDVERPGAPGGACPMTESRLRSRVIFFEHMSEGARLAPRETLPDAPSTTSAAAPTRSLTRTGRPQASASLTERPQVSPDADGSTNNCPRDRRRHAALVLERQHANRPG